MTLFERTRTQAARHLRGYRRRGLNLVATSSFQPGSGVLLHLLAEVAPSVPVYFVDTGFHFPETLRYRDALASHFGLTVRTVSPAHPSERCPPLPRPGDPDLCCHARKVLPLDPVLARAQVWITGVRASQTAARGGFRTEQPGRADTLRYHPLLPWRGADVAAHLEAHGIPRHPLEARGFGSVGCRPCTRASNRSRDLDCRAGRWAGREKTECGLHLEEGRLVRRGP